MEHAQADTSASESTSLEKLKVESTRQYFKSVSSLVTDIAKKNAQDARSIRRVADAVRPQDRELSTSGVDQDVDRFGLHAAMELRTASAAVKGIGIQGGAREKQIFNQPTYAAIAARASAGTQLRIRQQLRKRIRLLLPRPQHRGPAPCDSFGREGQGDDQR